MKTSLKINVPKILRFAFLALTAGGCLLLLLNLTAYFGITSSGAFLRGELASFADYGPTKIPLPDETGEVKIFHFQQREVVMMNFAAVQSLLQIRHLGYLLFQNLGLTLVIFAMYQMYRIFRNLEQKETFREDNTRRIRWIALAILFYPFVELESKLLFRSIIARIPGHNLQLGSGAPFSEQLILCGLLSLILFALAEVFRHGTHLQHEQDLTI